jgi:NhaP-type Na+/H+ or K+/H+ antiporter
MTGIIIGVEMIDKSTITVSDWVRMLIFWVLMVVMRFLMVASFYPVLTYFGYGLSRKEFVVLVYGGLRGALGLCLALMIGVDDTLPQRFRELTVFYMSGMAVMTILINGLTCSKLVNYVHMITTPPIK